MLKLACSIGNKVCIHGDDTVITGILCFQNLNDLIFDQLRILDFIRNDQVNAQHVVIRKGNAAVDNYDVIAVLDDGHVLANAVETAKRNDLQSHIGVVLHRTARIAARARLARARFIERFGLEFGAWRKLRALVIERDVLGARRGTTTISVRSPR